nr:hypothetical protein CFP56_61110 [Quercus suber]
MKADLTSALEDWCDAISGFEMTIGIWMGHWFSVLRGTLDTPLSHQQCSTGHSFARWARIERPIAEEFEFEMAIGEVWCEPEGSDTMKILKDTREVLVNLVSATAVGIILGNELAVLPTRSALS